MTAVLAVAAVVVALDQIVKVIVLDRLTVGVPVPIIDGFLSFTLVMNPGLAFGLLGGLPTAWRWLVAVGPSTSPTRPSRSGSRCSPCVSS